MDSDPTARTIRLVKAQGLRDLATIMRQLRIEQISVEDLETEAARWEDQS